MLSMLSTTVAGYFVAASLVTTTAVAGRGLVHSLRLAAQGQCGAAGLQALATPAVLAQTATAELLGDVIDTAREFSGHTLDATQPTLNPQRFGPPSRPATRTELKPLSRRWTGRRFRPGSRRRLGFTRWCPRRMGCG
jgi:hypothetical protein